MRPYLDLNRFIARSYSLLVYCKANSKAYDDIYTTYLLSCNHDIVSVHFNNFLCMEICDTPKRQLCLLTYIYLNVDEYKLTYSMQQQWKGLNCKLIIP